MVIDGDSNLVSSNIKNGVSIFGVTGTFTPDSAVETGSTSSIPFYLTKSGCNKILSAGVYHVSGTIYGNYTNYIIFYADGTGTMYDNNKTSAYKDSVRWTISGTTVSATYQYYNEVRDKTVTTSMTSLPATPMSYVAWAE